MAKLLFFIGPCGVGKSTICKEIIKRFNNFRLIKSDDFGIGSKNERQKSDNINKFQSKIKKIENNKDSDFHLIDVGGYVQMYIKEPFWQFRKEYLVCIYNNKDFCYNNFRDRPGQKEWRQNKKGFIEREFNDYRNKLYKLAVIKITTNKSIEENTFEVLNFILKRFYDKKQ